MGEEHPTSGETSAVPWAELAGAPATSESLVALAGVEPAALSGAALVDAIVASEKALSLLAGTQMRLLSALAVPFVAGDPMRLAAVLARKTCLTGDDDPDQVAHYVPAAAASLASAEVAAALRIPCRTAGIRVAEAEAMTGVLKPTLHSLEDGTLDRAKARVIADHCDPLDPEQTQDLQDLVLPGAGELTTSELRDVTGQAVIIVDPDGAENRHQEAAARRDLALQPGPDGMATLKARLPADGAVKIFQVTDLLATGTAGTPGDSRGIGARRVDALIDIADHLLTNGFVDLTDYLGQALPDHGQPITRARPARTSTDTASPASTETAGTGTAPADTGAPSPSTTEPSGPADTPTTPSTATEDAAEQIVDSAPATEDTGSDVGSTEIAAEPTVDGMTGTGDGGTESHGAAADVAATEVPVGRETPAPAGALTDSATTDKATTDKATTESATTDNATTDNAATASPSTATASADGESPAPAAAAPGSAGKRRGGNRVFTRQGRRPHLSVTLGLGTLAGLDNLPGSLAGYGAIPAGLARSIAASAGTINALITDPDTGKVTAAGALTYRPTQELRDQIAAILTVCQFPSCRQPVWRCDLDHREEFNHHHPEQGGKTDKENTGPLCKRHHLIKHHSAWRIRMDPNRFVLEFTSPTGHHYSKPGRQAAAPGLWVSTAATAIAERLDDIANPPSTLTRRPDDDPAPTGDIEDQLTTILIRHQLNTTIEIDYEPETTWENSRSNDPPPF